MADLAGRTVVITGGTGGIGLETAVALAGMGARLVLIGRHRDHGEGAVARIRAARDNTMIAFIQADLSRLQDIRRVAADLDAQLSQIDVLINNAGAIFDRREITVDGLERTFALNHLAYFLLTILLRDKLVRSAPARIINTASEAHRTAILDFDNLQMSRGYGGWKAYRRSKLCNILFTRELARQLAGTGVTANCLHPGFVRTGIGNNTSTWYRRGVRLLKRLFAIPVEEGARTPVYLASATAVEDTTGGYFIESKQATPSAAARDDAAARRLWNESLRLAGVKPL